MKKSLSHESFFDQKPFRVCEIKQQVSKTKVLKTVVVAKKEMKKAASFENMVVHAQTMATGYDFSHQFSHDPPRAVAEMILALATSDPKDLPGRFFLIMIIYFSNK